MRRGRRSRRKIESSKKILIFCDTLLLGSVIATFVALFKGYEVSSIVTLDGTLSGLSGVGHSFYYWKARAENLHKYGKDQDIEKLPTDDYDINTSDNYNSYG